jgi:predicted transcriptional regulator
MKQKETVTTKERFLSNLKFIMDERGLSHSDIGRLVDFSRQQVGNIFNGSSEGMNTLTMDKISKALGFNQDELGSVQFIENYNRLKSRYK